MFTPGDRPEMLRKAPGAGADTVVFDLEDAVAPARKGEAREAVREVLSDPEFEPDCEVCVRVGEPEDDLPVVLDGTAPDSLMLPKATGAEDVEEIASIAREHGSALPVVALIESPAGVLDAPEVAAAEATDALCFGAEDLAADIGATRTSDGTEVLYARERVVIAASAAGIDAIDTVYTDIEDTDGLAAETRFAAGLGYDGKMAIHPAQVEPIHGAFAPSEAELAWAKRVLEAREEADREGRGVFRVDGEMIDAPLIARAERIVERTRAAR
jgi:citrate lyase subunit beta / citryl-CoA lyase